MVKIDSIVVGAGVVGVTAALALQQRGMMVMLLDQHAPEQVRNSVNAGVFYAGAFPFGSCYRLPDLPVAFLKSSSSTALHWPSAPKLARWGVQYARATRPDIVWHGTDLLHALCRDSLRSFEQLFGTELPAIDRCGYLAVHLSHYEFDRAVHQNSIRKFLGATGRMVSGSELVALEPAMCGLAIGNHAAGSTFLEGSAHVRDPAEFVTGLTALFVQRGGTLRVDRVQGLESEKSGEAKIRCHQGEYSSGTVVVATGASSNQLLAQCGHRIPLMAERGYHLELDVEPGFISRPVALPGFGVVLVPSRLGARIAGISHFGSPGFRGRPRFLLSALERVRQFLPALRLRPGYEVESGQRPVTPDSLPVIERVPGHRSIFVSTGHGDLGLTLAAVSAGILADLATDRSSIYASELSSHRFRRSTKRQAVLRAA